MPKPEITINEIADSQQITITTQEDKRFTITVSETMQGIKVETSGIMTIFPNHQCIYISSTEF